MELKASRPPVIMHEAKRMINIIKIANNRLVVIMVIRNRTAKHYDALGNGQNNCFCYYYHH